jgi:hypothetical protein
MREHSFAHRPIDNRARKAEAGENDVVNAVKLSKSVDLLSSQLAHEDPASEDFNQPYILAQD